MQRKLKNLLLWTVVSVCVGIAAPALSAAPQGTPEALEAWTAWVLHGQEEQLCPPLQGGGGTRCVWPGWLDLEVDGHGGRFEMEVELFAPAWVTLPGDLRAWPQQVRTEAGDLAVLEREQLPRVYLDSGKYRLRGQYIWSEMPEWLALPEALALVAVKKEGRRLAVPDRDENGRLWLRERHVVAEPGKQEALKVTVFRKLVDDVPFQVETRLEVQVSGSPREEMLGGGLLHDATPLELISQLPARLEPDGRLRLQLRPGTWQVTLRSRFLQPPQTLGVKRGEGAWDEHEIWVFEARPSLRLVELEGAPVVDPMQTRLPEAWRQLPAYELAGETRLHFVEKRRGASGQLNDRLSLARTLWLDFEGQGFTVQDHIHGTMGASWRLDMPSPGELGRVSIAGVDQFITRVADDGPAGVEVRRGEIDLTADSRWEGSRSRLSAVGWSQLFQEVSATLNLPPGWLLVDVSGADRAPGTWLKRWSLLDLFLVLLIAIGAFRLWGWRWGSVALVAIGLSWHEPGAPRWVWLHLLAAAALLRVLPTGRAKAWVGWYRSLTFLVLVALAVVFMVSQVRVGLYPQLARPWQTAEPLSRPVAVTQQAEPVEEYVEEAIQDLASTPLPSKRVGSVAASYAPVPASDPSLQLQTGPGLPQWQWHSVRLEWNGPVAPDQQLRLMLLPPWVGLLLSLLRVALIGLLLWRVLDLEEPEGGWRRWLRPGHRVAALSLLACALAPVASARAEYPSGALLDQLQKRLLEAPECGESCASIARMHLEANPDTLSLRLLVDVQEQTAIPLPGQSGEWEAAEISLDGRRAVPVRREGRRGLWLVIPGGRHQVLLGAPLAHRNRVLIPLPLKPHQVSWESKGWELQGVDGQGLAEDQLQLLRIEPHAEVQVRNLEPSQFPPFVRVERTLQIGLNWQVVTRVTRLSSFQQPLSLDLPLLPGESPIDDLPSGRDGMVRVVLPPGVGSRSFVSILAEQPALDLEATTDQNRVEVWRLDLTPLWHAEFDGIPSIYPENPRREYLPEWRPWPGETLTVSLSRPQGVDGQTLTIDGARLQLSPGARATDATLSLEIRSSQGGQHLLTLPEGAELLATSLDGREQPVRQEGEKVYLPVHPGRQQIELNLRLSGGMGSAWRTPTLDLGARAVNDRIDVRIPGDRWVLLAGGPDMGPAVLFWGVVLIVIAAGLVLGRVTLTPLRSWEWILLGLGLSQGHVVMALLVAGWLLALGWRRRLDAETRAELFNLTQVGLVLLSVLALGALCWAVQFGLLGYPDMQISGNGSSSQLLRWYQDIAPGRFPVAWIVSLPMLVYRLFMLAWSLWLAFALLKWVIWGWQSFSMSGLWRHALRKGKFRFLGADGQEVDPQHPQD